MGLYYLNEAAFELPDGFVDRTVHVLESPSGVGLMLSRVRLREGKSFLDMVEQHLQHEERTLKAYAVLSRRERTVGAQPTIDVATRCRTDQGMQYGRQAHLVYRGVWLVLTATGALADRATCDDHFGRVLSTVRFRE